MGRKRNKKEGVNMIKTELRDLLEIKHPIVRCYRKGFGSHIDKIKRRIKDGEKGGIA